MIFIIKKRSEKNTFLVLKFISTQSMLIDQKLNNQFPSFEDNENTEIPLEEPGSGSFEDVDDEEEDDDDDDDVEDDSEKKE